MIKSPNTDPFDEVDPRILQELQTDGSSPAWSWRDEFGRSLGDHSRIWS